jgi:hypothetical protein
LNYINVKITKFSNAQVEFVLWLFRTSSKSKEIRNRITAGDHNTGGTTDYVKGISKTIVNGQVKSSKVPAN